MPVPVYFIAVGVLDPDPNPHSIGFLDPDPRGVKSAKTERKNGASRQKIH
jgi:hypothetical protein